MRYITPLLLFFTLLQVVSSSSASATEPDPQLSGFLSTSLYPYTEEKTDSALTVKALVNFGSKLQYFSHSNFGRDPSRRALENFDRFVTEQSLRWKFSEDVPLRATVQALLRSKSDNEALRFGLRWEVHQTRWFRDMLQPMGIMYWFDLHALQFDPASGYQWQMSHVFRWNVLRDELDNRVYIGGFADHNIDHADGTKTTWLQEAQLGVRVIDNFYAVAEQRYNGFRKGNEASLGLGVEYVIRF